jgi:hypothetical protein
MFNIGKLGLLAGQRQNDRWTIGGISDAVVYLNYLEEIYEDTVNALGSETRLGKHQSTAETDKYLGRAEKSDLDIHTLVAITLRLACLADNIFWTLATTNCVVRQIIFESELEETITQDLTKRTDSSSARIHLHRPKAKVGHVRKHYTLCGTTTTEIRQSLTLSLNVQTRLEGSLEPNYRR